MIYYFICHLLFGIRVVSVSYDKNINYVICTFNWNFRKSPNKNKNFRKCTCVFFIVKCRATWNNMFYLKKNAPWWSCNRCPKFREIWFHRPAVISLTHPIQLMLPWSWTNSAHQPLAGSVFLRKYVICKVME